jgi:glycosyltransferase involved in cell wall biosynthesis
VVADPSDPAAVARSIARLVDDPALRQQLGTAGRERAVAELGYDVLAARLAAALTPARGWLRGRG